MVDLPAVLPPVALAPLPALPALAQQAQALQAGGQ